MDATLQMNIRPGWRNYVVASSGLVVAALVALPAIVDRNALCALVTIALVLASVRVFMLRCWTDGDTLHVRDLLRTRSYTRPEIAGFHVEDAWNPGGRYSRRRLVIVDMADGTTRAPRAAYRPYWKILMPFARPRTEVHNEADDLCAHLERWRSYKQEQLTGQSH